MFRKNFLSLCRNHSDKNTVGESVKSMLKFSRVRGICFKKTVDIFLEFESYVFKVGNISPNFEMSSIMERVQVITFV